MRLSPIALLAGAATITGAQSLDKDAVNSKKATTFNGVTVPPLLEITPSNFEEELKKTKFLMIKHYSPYCPHCIDYAPTYQTLYEYYFTSHPDSTSETSFLEYYDFRFGMINCVAYYDLCVNNGVQTYPMTSLFEDGVAIESVRGVKSIEEVSQTVEAALEKQKPGSRPEIIKLPAAGDKEFPKGAGEQAEELKKDEAEDESKLKLKDGELPAQKAAGKDSTKSSAKDDKTTSKKESAKEEKSSEKEPAKPGKAEDWTDNNDWKSETSAETFNKKKPKKPTVTPNPNGVTISLTAESFQHMVTMTQDPWFIKFYAPWCPHCQAMGPTWDQLAKNMQGKLNIGEVNCDKESRLCKDVNARSYPTILFFKGGERAEYRGLRGLGDFVEYADKAIDLASGVPDVTAAEFEELEKKEDVIFTYFYDHATTSEDLTALERIPLSLIGHAKLVKTNDPALYDRFKITTWPRLIVSREGRPTYYTPLTPNEMRNVHGILDWMKSVWLPLVPELTAANAKQIMDGKVVVLGILNREDADGFSGALKEMKAAANEWMDRQIQEFQLERKKLRDAKQMRIEEAQDRDDERALRAAKQIRIDMNESGRKEVGFAWADGIFWQRWIRTTYGTDVSEGERVIINDQDAHKYYDQTVTGNYIMVSRTAISESLDKIIYGPNTITPKLTTTLFTKFFYDMRDAFVYHPYLALGSVVMILLAAYSWLRGRKRRAGGYFRVDESVGSLKDGLLGGNSNGMTKAD